MAYSPKRAERFFQLFPGKTNTIIEAAKAIGPIMNRMDKLEDLTDDSIMEGVLTELRKRSKPLKLDLNLLSSSLIIAGYNKPLEMVRSLQHYYNCLDKNPKTFGLRCPDENDDFDAPVGSGFSHPSSDYPWLSQDDNTFVLLELVKRLCKQPLATRQTVAAAVKWLKANPIKIRLSLSPGTSKQEVSIILMYPWNNGNKNGKLDQFLKRLRNDGTLPTIEIPPHLGHRFLPSYVGEGPDQIYEGPIGGVPDDRASRFRLSAVDYYFHHGGNLPNYILRDLGIRCGIVLTPQSHKDVWWKLLGCFDLDDNKRGGAGKGKALHSSRKKISEIDHKNPIVGQFQESIGGKDGFGIAWNQNGLDLYTEYQQSPTTYYEVPDVHNSIASYPPYQTMRKLSLLGDFHRKTLHLDLETVLAWTDQEEDEYDKKECLRLGRSCAIPNCELKLDNDAPHGGADRMFSSPDDKDVPNCRSHLDRTLINKEAGIPLADTLAEFSLGHIIATNNDALNGVSRRFAVIHSCSCGCGGYLGDHDKTSLGSSTLWSGALLCGKSVEVRVKPLLKQIVKDAKSIMTKAPETTRLDLPPVKPFTGATRQEDCKGCGSVIKAIRGHIADDQERFLLVKLDENGQVVCQTCFLGGYRKNGNEIHSDLIKKFIPILAANPTVLTLCNLSRETRKVGEGRAMRLPGDILRVLKSKGKNEVSPDTWKEFRLALSQLDKDVHFL